MVSAIADILAEKHLAGNERAKELFEQMRIEIGKREPEYEMLFDHALWMIYLRASLLKIPTKKPE